MQTNLRKLMAAAVAAGTFGAGGAALALNPSDPHATSPARTPSLSTPAEGVGASVASHPLPATAQVGVDGGLLDWGISTPSQTPQVGVSRRIDPVTVPAISLPATAEVSLQGVSLSVAGGLAAVNASPRGTDATAGSGATSAGAHVHVG